MPESSEILVCFAVSQEAALFCKRTPKGVRVLITGMGRGNSEREVADALELSRPSLVLTCGFAGGLDPQLIPGTVLYSTDTAPSLTGRLQAAGARAGKFLCSEKVLVTAAEKAQARKQSGADAVEMESGHISALCAIRGIPVATVRVVLDPATEDLPVDFNELMGPDLKIAPAKMARAIAFNPKLVPALLRLNRESRAAAESLARVLEKALAD